ncbi:MAG: endonuclease/exonuclease/phosphatase family protein [Candidatus Levyibacteriota bacterium]
MRIASYNILSGGFSSYNYEASSPERIKLLQKAIKIINADFIGLIDTFRWDTLYSNTQLAQLFGYKKAYCINLNDSRLRKKGHNNGITVLTNIPIKHFETISLKTRDAIKTTLQINNNKLDIFTVYLDDLSEDVRVKQAQILLQHVNQKKPTIIIGDLNTLSPSEITKVTPLINKLFVRYPQLSESLIPVLEEMKRGEVIKMLEENRFQDANRACTPTVPSKLFPIKTERAFLRLDYAFHTKNIQISNFSVPRDSIFDQTSDHYPIIFEASVNQE